MSAAGNDGPVDARTTRRQFLKQAGAAGVAVAGGTLWATAPAAARARRAPKTDTPIEHLIIACQENRSFDHYYGTMAGVRGFGDRAALRDVFRQRGDKGGPVLPFRIDTSVVDGQDLGELPHDWNSTHRAWNSQPS